jgi:hypothetical protein
VSVASVSGAGSERRSAALSTRGQPANGTHFSTVRPAFADPGLESELFSQGMVINARALDQPQNPLLTLLISFGPAILLLAGFL